MRIVHYYSKLFTGVLRQLPPEVLLLAGSSMVQHCQGLHDGLGTLYGEGPEQSAALCEVLVRGRFVAF